MPSDSTNLDIKREPRAVENTVLSKPEHEELTRKKTVVTKVRGAPHPAEYTKITYTAKQCRARNKVERRNKRMGRN